MEDQIDRDFRQKWSKEAHCPFHPGILCGEWNDPDFMETECPRCGWHPDEEARRKEILQKLVASGKWIPHLYSLEHYG